MEKPVTGLLKLFVKAEVIDNCKTFDLANIDLDKKSNFHEPNNMTVGFASEKTLKELKKDVIEDSDAKQFLLDCRTILAQMAKKLFKRSPLKTPVVQYCRIFDPKLIASYSKEGTKKALKSLLFQLLDRKYSDKAMKELEEFIDNEVILHKNKSLGFDKPSQHLDVFYFQSSISITKYTSFASILKFVCIRSPGQTSVREVLVLQMRFLKKI